jgi:hypothetical protein
VGLEHCIYFKAVSSFFARTLNWQYPQLKYSQDEGATMDFTGKTAIVTGEIGDAQAVLTRDG